MSGYRSDDFKFDQAEVKVVLGFIPSHTFDLTQAIGRGTCSHDASITSKLVSRYD